MLEPGPKIGANPIPLCWTASCQNVAEQSFVFTYKTRDTSGGQKPAPTVNLQICPMVVILIEQSFVLFITHYRPRVGF